MSGVGGIGVFDAKVVYYKCEHNAASVMPPQGAGAGHGRVPKLGENLTGLFEARHALANFHVDPAVRGGDNIIEQIATWDDCFVSV